ncbi:phosphodiester glycosidase family protein [Streptomyces rubrogriseus]|nr:phosphodiester glycosidase family protein [Streptomyces rubrogriseus]
MPLGPSSLQVRVGAVQTLAPGVTYQKFTQGEPSDVWSVWLKNPVNSGWLVGNRLYADQLAAELVQKGFPARVDTFDAPATSDTPAGTVGYTVRVSQFDTSRRTEAQELLDRLTQAGYSGRVTYTAEDGEPSSGPWEVRVVKIAPDAAVKVQAVNGRELRSAQTVREMAKLNNALVALNGAEYDISTGPDFSGFDGDPEGLYMKDNAILSEANNGRTALLLEGSGARARIAEVTSKIQVTAPNGDLRSIDGINRVPGRNFGCGGVGGDIRKDDQAPTLAPWRNTLCVDNNEVVVFRPEWGNATPGPGNGVTDSTEVVMNGNWVVQEIRSAVGGTIPPGGRVMQGIGDGAAWLRKHAVVGAAFKPGASVVDSTGRSVTSPTLSAVAGGGPALLRDGHALINTAANGMTNFQGRPNLSVVQRHPRTLAGVTSAGELLLVTVDGRQAGVSVGATWHEAAGIMQWLGAEDAVGLGSGGDSTLIINNTLYNRPTDTWGATHTEREVGSAVAVVAQ